MAYLLGEADEETVKRVEASIKDDEGEVSKYFEAMRRKANGITPLPGDSDYTIVYDGPLEEEDDW